MPGMAHQTVGERRVDRLGQGQRAGLFGQLAAERLGAGGRAGPGGPGGRVGDRVRGPQRAAGGQRRDDLGHAGQLGLAQHLLGHLADLPADLVVAGDHLVGREQARLDQQAGGGDQRVAFQVPVDLVAGPVGHLGVRPGVPHQPHHGQVQHGRAPLVRAYNGRLRRRVEGGHQVAAVGRRVAQAGPGAEHGREPAVGRRHADPEPVVLADQEQRQPYA